MTTSSTQPILPVNNPLEREGLDEVIPKAKKFWQRHKLENIVDEDEFVKGAVIFHDLKQAREFEIKSSRHTEEERSDYTEHEGYLATLSPRQNKSLRWYACRTPYEKDESDLLMKRLLFLIGDELFGTVRKDGDTGEPTSAEPKLLWDHTKTFSRAQWQIFATCCLAAMTQGWDQSSMNGANIAWPGQLHVDINTASGIKIFGWLNAAPFFVGALVGSLATDPLINAGLGRRWAILLGGICSLVPVVCTLFVRSWIGFMWCRIILGIGMGAKASVVPIYISEIAPEDIRGRMSMSWQLFDTFGILTGSVVNYIIYCYTQDEPYWQLMISLSGIPALVFMVMILFCVESPRWLIKKNKYKEALKALITLHQLPSPVIACGELYMIFRRLGDEESKYLNELKGNRTQRSNGNNIASSSTNSALSLPETPEIAPANGTIPRRGDHAPLTLENLSLLKRIKLLWRVRHIRRALRASQFVMAAQQACGINILAFMSNIMFANAMSGTGKLIDLNDSEVEDSLKFSIYFGIANCFSTFIPLYFIDGAAGRRNLLKFTFPLMAISLIAAGVGLFIRTPDSELGPKIFYAFTITFTVFFSIGEGPIAFVISSEVFPLMVRELGMSLAVFTNFFLASVLSFCIPNGLTEQANKGSFWMAFGGLNFVLWIMSILFVYETSGEKLEGIERTYKKSWKNGSKLGRTISGHKKTDDMETPNSNPHSRP